MKEYIELTKPRVTWLILMSAGVGFYFGMRAAFDAWAFGFTILGTGLLASGTFTLNQWYEREADAKMRRTKHRPLPEGRIPPARALGFGVALSLAGFAMLGLGANWLSAALGAGTLLAYLLLYTPLKQRSWHSTTVGAFPGAMPPLIGYAGAAGTLSAEAWLLFAILLLWQFPHFYSIAWLYRDDYARAGVRMLPVVEPDGRSTARQVLLTSAILIPVSMLPTAFSMAGQGYAAAALALGLYLFRAGWRLASERTLARARGVLLASVMYLPLLYGSLLLSRFSL